jgi:sec-independent protein translocase protein TatC
MSDTPKKDDELKEGEMPFVEHLVELRDRLVHAIIGLALAAIALAIWPGPSRLIDAIAIPIRAHMPPDAKLIATNVFSPFFVPIKVLFLAAFLLALPWLIYQAWRFVAPGLYKHEKRFALPLIFFGSLLAYGGIAFVQFFLLDGIFAFMQKFTPASVAATPDIASYVETLLNLYIAFALAFQVPIVVMLLVRFRMVTVAQLRDWRGYFLVGATIVAAVITPPDAYSMIAMALAMMVLYEIGILASTWFVKVSAAPPEEEEAAEKSAS